MARSWRDLDNTPAFGHCGYYARGPGARRRPRIRPDSEDPTMRGTPP